MFKSNIEKLHAQVENNEGLLLVIAAEAFFALMDVSIKLLGTDISVLEIVWVRMVVTYAFSIAYMYYAKINDPILGPPGVRILLTFRGMAGYIGIFGLYYSLQYLPLADAVALTFLTPLFTAVFGALLLKEKFGIKEASGAMISLIGATLIARPPFIFGTTGHHSEMELRGPETMDEHGVTPHQRIVAVGVALLGAVGAAIEYTLIGIIGKRAHPLHNTTYLAMLSITAATISMVVMKTSIIVPSKWSVAGLLVLVGIFGMISQTLMTMGYQREAIGRASMGVYTGMIFALILGKVIFGTVPGMMSFAGTAMILGSALYIALTNGKGEKKEGEKAFFSMNEGEDVEVRLLGMDERREDVELASA
ncbi:hypothetical protein M378DRAFT_85927 [Amanita muscaria Koide BX008]|uniref:EamA domain-containing protein n=1 Tax=Amanita muscaria (strain Koide BX008) TaxID=946122 RepID=A0A0C2SXE2_AMAMK|nr:hypothetical protein M378DRAFT_85927 [Amanita muscaria Koide BX008]